MSVQLADGCHYDGQWSEGKPNGQGRALWPDGWVFEGEFVDGKPHKGNLRSPGFVLDHSKESKSMNAYSVSQNQ